MSVVFYLLHSRLCGLGEFDVGTVVKLVYPGGVRAAAADTGSWAGRR